HQSILTLRSYRQIQPLAALLDGLQTTRKIAQITATCVKLKLHPKFITDIAAEQILRRYRRGFD
ncbi:MAG: hypothetical protein FWH27_18595, partial [Planctomycetaceae bacterium]|nr:hypothetical protein [Planctomycetaceae bacterium]